MARQQNPGPPTPGCRTVPAVSFPHQVSTQREAKRTCEMLQRTEQRPTTQVCCQGSPAAQMKGLSRASGGQPLQGEKTPSSHSIPLCDTGFLHSLLFTYWSLLVSVLERGRFPVNRETKLELKPRRSCLLCITSCSCLLTNGPVSVDCHSLRQPLTCCQLTVAEPDSWAQIQAGKVIES